MHFHGNLTMHREIGVYYSWLSKDLGKLLHNVTAVLPSTIKVNGDTLKSVKWSHYMDTLMFPQVLGQLTTMNVRSRVAISIDR